ncbi:lytic transglycosylase domain-containing protein [Celerinatantimonas sp. YJH-8]|uniref:lytic transglycosylase domain-containing protein n=1 Tax=Celerinatantimonas sp. YJH-8 TaxID=3228714 RepID=UPI0038C71833
MQAKVLFFLFLIGIGFNSLPAHADIWFFQDAQGEMHFAKTQMNPNWKLLLQTYGQSQLPKRFQIKNSPSQYTIDSQFIARSRLNTSSAQKLQSRRFEHLIRQVAQRYDLPVKLVDAVIQVESSYQHHAVSKAGAMGLMQLMPSTARRFNVEDPFEPAENIDAGSRYLKTLLNEFHSVKLALAAYNAGENAVRRYQGIPPYSETRQYIDKVMALLN